MAEERLGREIVEIMDCIRAGSNFLLSGGAGSGKTYSLVQILKEIASDYPTSRVACITYTNAAAIEIRNRAKTKNLKVSTIHNFLWETIAPFQKEMEQTLVELIKDPDSSIKKPKANEVFFNEFTDGIQYKEYVRLDRGEISHDEVIILAHKMYNKYQRLCDLLIDSFHFIFVDEYQDTSPLVIEILLSFLAGRSKRNIIGFFGDSMQSIYDDTIGNIDLFVLSGQVVKIEKEQNRRNPFAVIHLANHLRTDGLKQKPSDDSSAPNMKDGAIKTGSIKFLYSTDFNLEKVKSDSCCSGWDFSNAKKTKELRLTHNLIADEAGFAQLMVIYDADPLVKFNRNFMKKAEELGCTWDAECTFGFVVNSMDWYYKSGTHKGRQHRDVFLEDALSKKLYDYVKGWPYSKVQKIYLNKDNLIDNKVVVDDLTIHEPKRDRLIHHLFKIQEIISLYHKNQHNELIQKTSFQINNIADKIKLKDAIAKISHIEDGTIENVIDYADYSKICVKDDKLHNFIEENEYLYWRVKGIPFKEFQRLYMYLEGYVPLSTQHKIKGLEFDNVLIVLHNGGWSSYNFEYLFDFRIFEELTPAKQANYPSILSRTKKLFYVCCTRAKENLVVFYPDPTPRVLSYAKSLFGEGNCVNLDT